MSAITATLFGWNWKRSIEIPVVKFGLALKQSLSDEKFGSLEEASETIHIFVVVLYLRITA